MSPARSSAVIMDDGPLFRLAPFVNESFFGFTARLAAWNHFNGRRQFLNDIGFDHLRKEGLEFALENPDRAAKRLRLSEPELSRLTGGNGRLGDQYRDTLKLTARYFSPAGLRAGPFHRASWSQDLPYCAESWEILISDCPACGIMLRWTRVLGIESCEYCGCDLRYAETRTVPTSQRKILGLLSDLANICECKRDRAMASMPHLLSSGSPFDIFELAKSFARARGVLRERRRKLVSWDPVERGLSQAADLAAGMKMIADYPASFDALMTRRNGALPEFFRVVRSQGGKRAVPLYRKLYSDWQPCPHGPSRLRVLREEDGRLTLREAAQKIRVENRDLRKLIDGGLVGAPEGRGVRRRCQWLNPVDVQDVAGRLQDRMSLEEFSHRYKIPARGAAQLLLLALIEPNQDPVVATLHQGIQLHRSAAEKFANRLLAARHVATPDVAVLPLEDVFHGIGAQEKPWGAVLSAALEKRIPLYCDNEFSDQLQIRQLQIPRALADAILAGERPDLRAVPNPYIGRDHELMTRVEVENYLNCFPRDVSWLLAERHLGPRLWPDKVAELGEAIISSREIIWRWRVSPALRGAMERERGLRRTLGPFWSRAEVERFFAERFPAGRPV